MTAFGNQGSHTTHKAPNPSSLAPSASEPDTPSEAILEALDICKSFPGVRALDRVSLTLRPGRLTALLGENGAGKSTLMNIIAGVFRQDTGEVKLAGQSVRFASPREARDAGITMIYQELNLVANLSVAQNIFLGREPLNRLGLIDTSTMNRDAESILKQVNLDIPPNTPLNQLRVGQQQLVEIAKAISCNARVIIMDEPTSAITDKEIDTLFGIINRLKSQGVAIAYITHKLEELTRIGDDAVVMRDGQLITTADLSDLSRDEIIRLMVGREMTAGPPRHISTDAPEVLRIENLSLAHPDRVGDFLVNKVGLNVRSGEVLGIFGLMGAGRTELLETIFGLHPKHSTGALFIHGKRVQIRCPADAIAHGLALAPEDRKREGVIMGMTVEQNTSLACLQNYERWGLLNKSAETAMANTAIRQFKVKTPSGKDLIRNLSGGNQQKVILGKWLATKPKVLLLDEPTRGIDVGAKAEIYSMIHKLGASGIAVIVVSSELPEILTLADRIVVLCEGKKTAEFNRTSANNESIIEAALPQGVSNA